MPPQKSTFTPKKVWLLVVRNRVFVSVEIHQRVFISPLSQRCKNLQVHYKGHGCIAAIAFDNTENQVSNLLIYTSGDQMAWYKQKYFPKTIQRNFGIY